MADRVSSGIWAEHVLASNPSVSFHVNGGPTAMPEAGFGAFDTPFDYAPLMRAARRLGMVTTMHTGGSSIPKECLCYLTRNPFGGRVCGDVDPDEVSAIKAHRSRSHRAF
jgi:hypothetical protein